MQAGASSGDEFWHESDRRKTAPAVLSLLAVRLYCLRRNAWPRRFCESHDEGLTMLLAQTLQERLTTPLSARFLTVLCQQRSFTSLRISDHGFILMASCSRSRVTVLESPKFK
jgi:hypothetical protein